MMSCVDSSARELSLVTQRILAIHRKLAESTSINRALERELNDLWAKRSGILVEIGSTVFEHIRAGGSVSLTARPGAASTALAAPSASNQTSDDHERIVDLVQQFGQPDEYEDVESLIAAFARVRRLVNHCDRWLDLIPTARRHAMGASVAWLRSLQQDNEALGEPLREAQIIGLISRLSQWSREHRPGWVNGLARGATPDGASWTVDVAYHLDAMKTLVELDNPDTEAIWCSLRHAVEHGSGDEARWIRLLLARGVDSSRIATKLSSRPDLLELLGQPENAECNQNEAGIEDHWPWASYAHRQELLILGGKPDSDTASALKQAFGFAKVTWDPASSHRLELVEARLERGGFDLVLVVEPVGEDISQLLARTEYGHTFPSVRVVGSLSVASMKAAMEQTLEPDSADDTRLASQVSHSLT